MICLKLSESFWPNVQSADWYQQRKEQLRSSYAWDKMVQDLADDILAERMLNLTGNVEGIGVHERRVRLLASAPRDDDSREVMYIDRAAWDSEHEAMATEAEQSLSAIGGGNGIARNLRVSRNLVRF